MDSNERGPTRDAWFVAAAVVFAAAVVYAIVAAIASPASIDVRDDAPLLILGAAGLSLLFGWWRDRARRSAAEEAEQHERERLENELRETREELGSARENEDALRQESERLESRLGESERELGRERYLRMRSERAHQAERNWHRELHSEVMRLSRDRGALGDPHDVPSMVLRLVRTLVGAEKGLLLLRQEEDGEGGLDLVCSGSGVDNVLSDSGDTSDDPLFLDHGSSVRRAGALGSSGPWFCADANSCAKPWPAQAELLARSCANPSRTRSPRTRARPRAPARRPR
jgi:hypothetical protein